MWMLMWVGFIGFLAVLVLAGVLLDRRRGSSGVYRIEDRPGTKGSGRNTDLDNSWGGPSM